MNHSHPPTQNQRWDAIRTEPDGHWKRLLSGGHLWKGFGPGLCEPGNGECLRPLTNTRILPL